MPQAATTHLMSAYREPTAFVVGQADPAAHASAQDAVFFDQVRHGRLLPLVRRGVQHGARVYTTDPISALPKTSAEQ